MSVESLALPRPEERYSPENEAETRRQIEEADQANLKRDRHVELQPGQLIIVTSSGGFRFAIKVDDAGVLSTTPL